jgi:hypothetical protein
VQSRDAVQVTGVGMPGQSIGLAAVHRFPVGQQMYGLAHGVVVQSAPSCPGPPSPPPPLEVVVFPLLLVVRPLELPLLVVLPLLEVLLVAPDDDPVDEEPEEEEDVADPLVVPEEEPEELPPSPPSAFSKPPVLQPSPNTAPSAAARVTRANPAVIPTSSPDRTCVRSTIIVLVGQPVGGP